MVSGSKSPEGGAATTSDAVGDGEAHVPWFKRSDAVYDALPTEPIAVHELAIATATWKAWSQSARNTATRMKRLSNLTAVVFAALVAVPCLMLLSGASKSVAVCVVPLAAWGSWRIVRDWVFRRTFSKTVRAMRAELVPELSGHVTDLELMHIAANGAGPVLADSKVVRVEIRSNEVVLVISEYDLRRWEGYFPTGSSFTS